MKFFKVFFSKSTAKWELIANHWKTPDKSIIHHFDEVKHEEKVWHKK